MSLDLSVGVLKDTTHTNLANVLWPVSDLLKDIFSPRYDMNTCLIRTVTKKNQV